MSSHTDISLDFSFLLSESLGPAGLEKREIEALEPTTSQIHKGLTDLRRLGQMPFCDLPYHEEGAGRIVEKAGQVRDRFDDILLLGIGGSSLGVAFLEEALGKRGEGPKLWIVDYLDAALWKELSSRVDFNRTLLLVISKSGKTLETLAAFSFFRQKFKDKNIFVITDPQDGPLRQLARQNSWDSFDIPPGVGGRFSVLTAVGLFPAACRGVDINELLAGARRMDERCKNENAWYNPALMSAVAHYLFDIRKGRRIRVVMPYAERLRSYAFWFSQLWAESLGKRMSLKGKEIFSGPTPLPASGPRDQHSLLQLILEGPQDKAVTFVAAEKERDDVTLENIAGSEALEMVLFKGKTVHGLLDAERKATALAMRDAGRPSETIFLKEVNPFSVGQLLIMAEMETVYAGELYNVNPFDQPAVEKIKKYTKEFL